MDEIRNVERSLRRQNFSKHDADIAFLARVRSANAEELKQIEKQHRHKSVPEWKRVAIQRAIGRLANAVLEKAVQVKAAREDRDEAPSGSVAGLYVPELRKVPYDEQG